MLALPLGSTEEIVSATSVGSGVPLVAQSIESGAARTKIDLGGLTVAGRWPLPGRVTGVQPAADLSSLYVSFFDRVVALDPETGTARRQFMVTGMGPIDHVAPALPPIVQPPKTVGCAC